MPRLLTRDFALLTAAHFLSSLGFASMLLLPLYLDWLGAGRAEIGAVMAAASVAGLLSRPLVALSLDTLGRRPTLAAGSLLAASGLGLVGLVQDLGPMTWGMRLLFGVGEGAMFAGYFTFAADLVPPARRTEGIALFGVSGLLPLAVSPLAELSGVDAPALRWFLPCMGLVVLASTALLWPLGEPLAAVTGDEAPARAGLLRRARPGFAEGLSALRARPLWPTWLATVLFAGLVGVFFAFSTVVAEGRGLPMPTALWLSYAGGAAGVRLLGARLLDRLGTANLVTPALAGTLLGFHTLAGASSQGELLLAGLFAGLGHGTCFPVLTSQVVSRTPLAVRGSALSLFTALWAACALALTPLAGALADALGDGLMLVTAAGLATLGLAPWALLEHRLGAGSVLTIQERVS